MKTFLLCIALLIAHAARAADIDPALVAAAQKEGQVVWYSTLIVNQGGSQLDGPAFRHQGNTTHLYPYIWLEDFVDPYLADMI